MDEPKPNELSWIAVPEPIDLEPRVIPWRAFEDEVATFVEDHIPSLGLSPKTARVIRKPRYFSKDRKDEIIFDVGVELADSAALEAPYLIWLWECKDYASHDVSVDEVEEFQHKMVQVGAHKGTIVTRHGFQKGAIEVAKSFRMGMMILQKQPYRNQRRHPHVFIQKCDKPGSEYDGEITASYNLTSFGYEGPYARLALLFDAEICDLVNRRLLTKDLDDASRSTDLDNN